MVVMRRSTLRLYLPHSFVSQKMTGKQRFGIIACFIVVCRLSCNGCYEAQHAAPLQSIVNSQFIEIGTFLRRNARPRKKTDPAPPPSYPTANHHTVAGSRGCGRGCRVSLPRCRSVPAAGGGGGTARRPGGSCPAHGIPGADCRQTRPADR